MAERIVSPGVFTRERDVSFLPQGIAEIGAAVIGPTVKGPAFTPIIITSFSEFEDMFGSTSQDYYTPYTVQQYLDSAPTVSVVRVLGIGGYGADTVEVFLSVGATSKSAFVLAPSRGGSDGAATITAASIQANDGGTGGAAATYAHWSGSILRVTASNASIQKSVSFDSSSANFIENIFSFDPNVEKSGTSVMTDYLYASFKTMMSDGSISSAASASAKKTTQGINLFGGATSFNNDGGATTWTGNSRYQYARTPFLQSQAFSGNREDLFRVYTRSHGTTVNKQYKVNVLGVKDASAVAGSDYGTFSLQVRSVNYGNSDKTRSDNDSIIEQFDGLSMDPDNVQYFARVIGDRFVEIDSNGELSYYGDYPNMSKLVRIGDYSGSTALPKTAVPMGTDKVYNPIPGGTNVPTASFKTNQSSSVADFDQNVFYGYQFSAFDNRQLLGPIIGTSISAGSNVTMSLEDMKGHTQAAKLIGESDGSGTGYTGDSSKITLSGSHIQQRKFTVPFQWGFDGFNPAAPKSTGAAITAANQQGFDHTNSSSSGSVAYKRAINAISNPDEFDINLLATPGVNHRLHSTTTNHAIDKVEDRADALYIMDSSALNDTITTVTNTIKTLDSNYVATYYPWVKIQDKNTAKPIWVPPSVVLPGVIAFNDQVAHEWFAPAGLNRGGLTSVLEAKKRLTHSDRDDLYDARVNPIATFPGQGVVVFGQKTLQAKPSALDRVNVRRLLIALKKFIASTSRFLVFEQNTAATRNRFLNVVNPFLEDVQANSGLSAFRVVMDDSNNTPAEIDRYRLIGQIFIQPTRTAEFIVLDFVVQPTGAAFPE